MKLCSSDKNRKVGTSIIFLNGASSSGKTTVGRALQSILDEPYFYFSSDQLVEGGILPHVDRSASDGPWSWAEVRPGFFDGFHRAIAAFADSGNRLIVEHVLEAQSWLDDCVELLAEHDVFFVGVHCPLVELERRERDRGDRYLGEGKSHLEDGVHTWAPYDFEIDTSAQDPEESAKLVHAAFLARPSQGTFRKASARQFEAN